MCLNLTRMPSGARVKCGQCRICIANRIKDLVGRCLAEQAHATNCFAVTLTYADNPIGSVVLQYRDVQLMLKRLRADGYSVRYLCAGEYGERKGRAHWHCALFFRGAIPLVEQDRRVNWKYWPQGYSFFQTADARGFSYICKYVLKDARQRVHVKQLRLSKYPPLGASYFQELADRMVAGGFALHEPTYSFAAVTTRDPKTGRSAPRKFWLADRSLELFLERYVSQWEATYGREPPGTPFLWEKYYDPIARKERLLDEASFEAELAGRPVKSRPPAVSEHVTPSRYLLLEGGGLCVRYSDNRACILEKDGTRWLLDIGKEPSNVDEQMRSVRIESRLKSVVKEWFYRNPR